MGSRVGVAEAFPARPVNLQLVGLPLYKWQDHVDKVQVLVVRRVLNVNYPATKLPSWS